MVMMRTLNGEILGSISMSFGEVVAGSCTHPVRDMVSVLGFLGLGVQLGGLGR